MILHWYPPMKPIKNVIKPNYKAGDRIAFRDDHRDFVISDVCLCKKEDCRNRNSGRCTGYRLLEEGTQLEWHDIHRDFKLLEGG